MYPELILESLSTLGCACSLVPSHVYPSHVLEALTGLSPFFLEGLSIFCYFR